MYLSILKRDLKRKKTMNVILLLFMTLSVMFVSSSVNTMISVMSSEEAFLNISGAEDYFIATVGTQSGEKLDEKLSTLSSVESVKKESIFYLTENSVAAHGEVLELQSMGILSSIDNLCIHVYDSHKQELTRVDDGEVYLKASFMEQNEIAVGDKIKLKIGKYTKEFTVKDHVLNALFGSEMMGTPQFVISQTDFDDFARHVTEPIYDSTKGNLFNIATSDVREVETAASGIDGVAFVASRDVIKMTYILDMIIAGIFLIVSICLIIISLVLLKFTIGFTLSEEYREIGVMKAIGIKNSKIRTLYMVKYLAMALLGAVIGFAAGIPFGDMMTGQSTKNFVTGSSEHYLVNLICSVAVVLIIALFCRLSTRKVRKFTPVIALRSGETGRRYKKKGLFRLSKSRLSPVMFMAVNDIFSGFRHFAVMTVTFIVGILMIAMMINTISTQKSPKLLAWFSMADCDLTLNDKDAIDKYTSPDGQQLREKYLKEMEQNLAAHDIPAHCFAESIFKFPIQKGENQTVSLTFIGSGTTTDQYAYIEGTPPQNENEVALSHVIANRLDVSIGDTVTIKTGGENETFIVTALYQSMNNMGEGIRLSEKLDVDFSNVLGFFSYQIKYTDSPSSSEQQSRMETIRKLYPDYTMRTAGEYVNYSIGNIAGILDETKNFIVGIVMIINILVVVLMEKSFLTKERGEIALLKALGFKNRTLILWQTIRIAILMIAAVIIAILLTDPASQLAIGGIFKMMGAKYIIFDNNILEAYILYPLLIFAVTIPAVVLSALGIRKISSQEVNNIE